MVYTIVGDLNKIFAFEEAILGATFIKSYLTLAYRSTLLFLVGATLLVGGPVRAGQATTSLDIVSDALDPVAGNWITYSALLTCVEAHPTGDVSHAHLIV